MVKKTEKQIIKIHDRENTLYSGNKLLVKWNIGGEIIHEEIDFVDFIGWMYETGRIENYHTEGNGLVEIDADHYEYSRHADDYVETRRGTWHYTFEQFLETVTDSDLISYKTCQS